MTPADPLIRRFVGGDPAAAGHLVAAAAVADDRVGDDPVADDPVVLVAAALAGGPPDLLGRAAAAAVTTRDRQLVAIAAAHLAGDADRVDVLARDHLADHPDSILVAWIAGAARSPE